MRLIILLQLNKLKLSLFPNKQLRVFDKPTDGLFIKISGRISGCNLFTFGGMENTGGG